MCQKMPNTVTLTCDMADIFENIVIKKCFPQVSMDFLSVCAEYDCTTKSSLLEKLTDIQVTYYCI